MIPLKVLLIEDSESDSALMVRVLEKAGYEVIKNRVENKTQLINALEKPDWDIILADYQLPIFNAPAALEILQDSGLDIPFIVVSGAIGEETAVSLMKSGACDYVMKNSLSRLPAIVERELSETHIRRGRKNDLEALRLQSAALDSAANSIVITDLDGTITWANSAFTKLTGYGIAEAVGKNPRDLVKSGYHDQLFYQKMWDKILGGEVWQGEILNKHKNGFLYYEELTITPLRDSSGVINQFIAIKQDITVRKNLEKEMRQWADAFLNCAHGIIMVNPETDRIINCNPAFAQIYGGEIEKMVGKPMLSFYAVEDSERLNKFIMDADQDGQAHYEARLIRKDKSGIPIQMDVVSVRDASGTLLYRVSTIQDISNRKKAEQLLVEKMEERNRRAHELETITSISSSMRQAETQAELEKVILQKLVSLMSARYGTIAFMENSSLLFSQAIGGVTTWRKHTLKSDDGIFNDVIRRGEPVFVEKIDSSKQQNLPVWINDHFPNLQSFIVFPLKSGASTVGIVFMGFEKAGLFEREQRNLVEAVSEMAGNALNRMSSMEKLNALVNRRERELESIYLVTSSASKTFDIQLALQKALALTIQAVDANGGAIFLLDENSTKKELIVSERSDPKISASFKNKTLQKHLDWIIDQNKAIVVPHINLNNKLSFIGFPMRAQDRVVGIMAMIREGKEEVILEEMTLLSFIADHLALIIENTKLFKKAERAAILDERSRLSRELHDSITQSLYSANLISAGAQKYAAQHNYPEVDSCLIKIGKLSQQALREMRLMIYELRSPELAKNGLEAALQIRLDAVERRLNIKAEIEGNCYSPLSERIEENLYRIAIEGLNNSLKHSQASKISIIFNSKEKNFFLVIQDNGIGFELEPALHAGGIGLTSMRERAEQLGGSFQLSSRPGNGTLIEVRIPVVEKHN